MLLISASWITLHVIQGPGLLSSQLDVGTELHYMPICYSTVLHGCITQSTIMIIINAIERKLGLLWDPDF